MPRPPRTRSLRRLAGAWSPLFVLLVLAVGRAEGQEYWWVSTRDCPQILGSDPWPFLQASRLEARGQFSRRDPAELPALAVHRPVVFLVHGSYYTADMAVSEGLRIRDDLAGVLPPDAVVVAFDWPSQLAYPNLVRDANEKARRAFVAGYHLAQFLRGFPPGSRVSLVGQSHGGLASLAALHLLGGGVLDDRADATMLPAGAGIPPLRLRAVVISSASDRQWLDPGERLGRALAASEGILCLYNRLDPILFAHPFGRFSDHRRALGKVGMSRVMEERLGPLAARYRERNIGVLIGPRHTFRGATAVPTIAGWIGPYVWGGGPA